MLSMNFKAALERREIEQSIEGAPDMAPDTGNAFSGSKAVMDRETMYAIDNALMNDDDGAEPSSIGNAALMLAGKFAAAASKKEKEKSRQMMWEVLMQKMLDDLNERLAEIDGQLEALDQIKQMMAAGTFDPAEDANHLALLQQVDPTMTLERWDALSEQGQVDWARENTLRLNEERDNTQAKIEAISDPDSEIAANNNVFNDPDFEAAAKNIEAETGQEFDRHNVTFESRVDLFKEMYLERERQSESALALQQTQLQETISFESDAPKDAVDVASFSFS